MWGEIDAYRCERTNGEKCAKNSLLPPADLHSLINADISVNCASGNGDEVGNASATRESCGRWQCVANER